MDLQHSASYQGEHAQSHSQPPSEPLTPHLHYASTEPGPDRTTEAISHSDETAEGLAAQLEALQPPSHSPVPFFAQAYAHGEGSREKELQRPASSTGSNSSSKAAKRTSTARKVIETLTTKATGYFSPSHLQSHSPAPSFSGDGGSGHRPLQSHSSSGSTSTITSSSGHQEQTAPTSSGKSHKATASTSSVVLGGGPPTSSKDASKTSLGGNAYAHTLR